VHSCGVFQLVARTARKVSTIAHHDGSAAHSVSTKHHDAVTEVFSSFFVSSLVPTCYPGKHGSMEAWKHGSMEAWKHGSMEAALLIIYHKER